MTITLDELRSRPERAQTVPHEAGPRRGAGGRAAPAHPRSNGAVQTAAPSSRSLPQAQVDEILGPAIGDTPGFVPPDTMGAVGPAHFLFSVNGRFRAFTKSSPHTQIFDIGQQAFWGASADAAGVGDGHVRYDRNTQRWFITEIDVPTGDNHILLGVSSGPDLSTATWTVFAVPATGATSATDKGCFADYDTPGIDQSAIYIGANMFGGVSPCTGGYLHSNLYVVQKSSALTATLHYTTFNNVAGATGGIATIQGVDSVDALTTGYAIAAKETESPTQHLNVWQIADPGTTSPSLSAPTAVAIPAENGSQGGVLSHNNVVSTDATRRMDDLDDRLFSAVIRDGHLWTAHNIGVDSTGNANGATPTRDAMRWYDINVAGLTQNQSGTVFDAATAGFLEYWMGTLMVSGQGHVAMGLNRANSTTDVQAGAVGRLAGDAAGTMSGFTTFQNSTADAYDDASFISNPANRWGDYTYTSLDPCDDMTMWTTQEYVAAPSSHVGWRVAAEKLLAPAPAMPATLAPNPLPLGETSVNVTVTGTSAGGSGFYDTPASLTDPCRTRLQAAVSGGVVVNSVTYVDPTHITLNLSTSAATLGLKSLTVTNPDGQTVVASNFFNVEAATTLPAMSNGAYGGYVTAVTVQNHGSAPSDVSILYFDQAGNPVGTGDAFSSLPVNASWTVRQDNTHSFPNSGGNAVQAGSAVVYSTQPIASFVNEFAPGGVGDATSYTGIPVPSGVGTALYAPTIVNDAYGGYTTGIGLLNQGSGPTNVTIAYRDSAGALVRTQTVTGLAANAYRALYSGDGALSLPDGFAGTATITGSAGQPLGAIVNEAGPGGQNSSYDAVPAGSTSLNAPAALNNAFGGYFTGMGIQNTSATAGNVSISYYDATGTAAGAAKVFSIPANGSLGVYQGSATDGPPTGAYTAVIQSTLPLAAIVNEVAPPGTGSARQSTSYNTFPAGSGSLHLPLVENGGSDPWNTGEGIMNTGATGTTVTVTYYNAVTGAAVGTPDTSTLAPQAFLGLYQPAGNLPAGSRATAVVTTSSGGQVAVICNESSPTTFMSYSAQ